RGACGSAAGTRACPPQPSAPAEAFVHARSPFLSPLSLTLPREGGGRAGWEPGREWPKRLPAATQLLKSPASASRSRFARSAGRVQHSAALTRSIPANDRLLLRPLQDADPAKELAVDRDEAAW